MRLMASLLSKLVASSLCLLFVSCSVARPVVMGPSGPRELSRYVLMIEETRAGQVTSSWMPLENFDQENHQHQMSMTGANPRIVRVSRSSEEYCRGRRKQ